MTEPKEKLSNEEALYALADLTRRWGMLHEVQALNLRNWPLVMLEVKSSQCEYHHESRKLYFTLGDFVGTPPENMAERLDFLEQSCQMLLGEDVHIAVRTTEGTTIYGSFSKYPVP